MKQWHLEHVEKTIKKFITGLPETATIWEKDSIKNTAQLQIAANK